MSRPVDYVGWFIRTLSSLSGSKLHSGGHLGSLRIRYHEKVRYFVGNRVPLRKPIATGSPRIIERWSHPDGEHPVHLLLSNHPAINTEGSLPVWGRSPGFFEAAVDSLLVKPRVRADFLAGQLAFVIWVTVNQSLWETTKESPREEYSWSSPHPAINPSLMLTAVVLDIRLHVPWCGGKFCLQTHPLTASWK